MADLKLEEIAERISNAVLEERMLSKDNLMKLIHPILKIWIKSTDKSKRTGKVRVDKLLDTIDQRGVEKDYWRDKLKDIVGSDKMELYYKELADIHEKRK